MAVKRIRADYPILTQITQQFTQEASATQQTLDKLQENIGVLQQGDWVGQGATQFYQEMNAEVLPALKRLRAALEQTARATTQINQIMQQAEADAARVFVLRGGSAPAGDGGKQPDVSVAPSPAKELVDDGGGGGGGAGGGGGGGGSGGGSGSNGGGSGGSAEGESNEGGEAGGTGEGTEFNPPLADMSIITHQKDDIDYDNSFPSYTAWDGIHVGTDYSGPEGAEISASTTGTIVASGDLDTGYGNYVIIEYKADEIPPEMLAILQTQEGYEEGDSVYMMYAHMQAPIDPATMGLATDANGNYIVEPGTVLGNVGMTGNAGGVPHLHMEVRFGDPGLDVSGTPNTLGLNNWVNPNTVGVVDPELIFPPAE